MEAWDNHYTREKSKLNYPDEYLVRMLSKEIRENQTLQNGKALDLGCGSGRHLKLLNDFNFNSVIGADLSFHALKFCDGMLMVCDNIKLPIKNESIDIIIAWGSLHYNYKSETPKMITEILRILKKSGIFLGTLRSSRDTYLKKGTNLGNDVWQTSLTDIEGSISAFFCEEEINSIFSQFETVQLGLSERTIMGDLDKLISHWIIRAIK
jgi:SAM-dependent methyltransferase